MRKRRTIYHNDARHYYLWVFDSPIKMEDAWRPIDEVAGNLKSVPADHSWVEAARRVGTSMGD